MRQRISASDVKLHLEGTRCDRRVWIKDRQAAKKKKQGEFEKVIQNLGIEHEERYAESEFPDRLDLGGVEPLEECARRTLEALGDGDRVVYQGALITTRSFGGKEVEVVGRPDFLVPVDGGFTVRDAKIARDISESKKPEVMRQLQLYGWLFEQVTGEPPQGLEVFSGKEELVSIERDDAAVLAELEELHRISQLDDDEEPFEVVGWSKCENCPYTPFCWDRAVSNGEPGTIPGVDVGLGERLDALGIDHYQTIPDQFDESSLAEVGRPFGPSRKDKKLGQSLAAKILNHVKAHLASQPLVLAEPEIPKHEYYVMFDLEGVPPQRDGVQKVYLWGLQVYPADGSSPDEPLFPQAGFDPQGDKDGWEKFLGDAGDIMRKYGEDVPFVHWANYERAILASYIETYGDPEGVATKMLEHNLLDLRKVTEKSVALPCASYSLKVVEKYLGYQRKSKLKGDESIAWYLEAASTDDDARREELMEDLLEYNGEDLYATWVVLRWLQGLPGKGFAPAPASGPQS